MRVISRKPRFIATVVRGEDPPPLLSILKGLTLREIAAEGLARGWKVEDVRWIDTGPADSDNPPW